jgi:small subunit ribosomal protein S11
MTEKKEKKQTSSSVRKTGVAKKIKKISEARGVINAYFSFNNTILSLSKENGDVLSQISAGSSGYRGARKATSYAAQKTTEKIIEKAQMYGIKTIKLRVKGIGAGRDAVIKKIIENKVLNLEELIDKTPVPFNGTRSRKKPRK